MSSIKKNKRQKMAYDTYDSDYHKDVDYTELTSTIKPPSERVSTLRQLLSDAPIRHAGKVYSPRIKTLPSIIDPNTGRPRVYDPHNVRGYLGSIHHEANPLIMMNNSEDQHLLDSKLIADDTYNIYNMYRTLDLGPKRNSLIVKMDRINKIRNNVYNSSNQYSRRKKKRSRRSRRSRKNRSKRKNSKK